MFLRLLAAAVIMSAAVALNPPAALADKISTPLAYCLKGAVMLQDGTPTPARMIGQGRQPSLSPGARLVAWVEHGEEPSTSRIASYDAASGEITQLAKPGGFLNSPRYSPDGRNVAFTRSGTDGRWELWLAGEGGQAARIAGGGPKGESLFEPAWTPDGAFITVQDMHWLYFIRPDGAQARRVALNVVTGGRENDVTSADRFSVRPGGGGEILFSLAVPGTKLFQKKVPDVSSALFLFDPKTGKTTRLTPENLTAFNPSWTPDGAGVVFTGYADAQAGGTYPFRVWSMRIGETPLEITPGEDAMPPSGS